MELPSYFDGLLANIEPDVKAINTAKKEHKGIRELLEKDSQVSRAEPDTYLSGSYARGTAIKDIKDVDIILEIDIDHKTTEPDSAIFWLLQILQGYYSEVRPQGRSVGVTTDSGFDLDIVLATPISHRRGPVWIPDREAKHWVASHPKAQIEFASQKNTDTGGCYKPLVKIMKFWRDRIVKSEAKVKSYILEALVAESLAKEPLSYANAVTDIFRSIDQKYSKFLTLGSVPIIPDPGYPSVNVAKRWTSREFSAFLTEVKDSYVVAAEALNTDDENKSIRLWRVLFGSEFKQ